MPLRTSKRTQSVNLRPRLANVGFDPPQARLSGIQRALFAANPAIVSNLIDEIEQEWIVDLASARLVASGIVR